MSTEPAAPPSPRATYRVQINSDFTLDDAAGLADYLADLGVSHLYCSPYLQAAPGSRHGYDVVDYHQVNAEAGGAAGHARLVAALRQYGVRQILDIVPNHMAIAAENPWWWDVLQNGPASQYSSYFDVDWDPPDSRQNHELLLPVLGDHYGRVLEAGQIRLDEENGRLLVRYGEQRFPVDPRSMELLLEAAAARGEGAWGLRLGFLAEAFGHLPRATLADRASAERRSRHTAVLEDLLRELRAQVPEADAALRAAIEDLNSNANALDRLLERQNYRLAHWKLSQRELGYRRFFDVNSLIGLRQEDERVFNDSHSLVLRWLRAGILDGVRVDHPDGLRDPEGYLRRLREACPSAWIVVEKILEPGEPLPECWPVEGTTGYDFLNQVNSLLVDAAGAEALSQLYTDFTGQSSDFQALALDCKRMAANDVLGSDLNQLTALLLQIAEHHRRQRDYPRPVLRQALAELAVQLGVYRTYVRAGEDQVTSADSRYMDEAAEAAKQARPELDPALFDFLRDILLLRVPGEQEFELAMRFQQFTGPVMAKGVEDTALYIFQRLTSLNEVGGSPGRLGLPAAEFHQVCQERQRHQPLAMLATSTHDTKRSEDVRARLNVLSEIPQEWSEAVQRWAKLNEAQRAGDWPDRNTEYLFYQTLVGAWPLSEERAQQYLQKAVREAKTNTSWAQPNAGYEAAVAGFVHGSLNNTDFCRELESFVARVRSPGWIKSLAQTLIKLTAPGVPDIYQGNELWDLSLVDPDNRRPVDFDQRRRLLAELDGLSPEAIWARAEEGLPKLWVVRQALRLRQRQPEAFGPCGDYQPIPATNDQGLAFGRGQQVVTVVPLWTAHEREDQIELELPSGAWHNELTGDTVNGGATALRQLLARFPVALLSRVKAPDGR
jgi:(1->4)-alpha-D-glucan 1-alpha-D-glucosylmutase